MIASSQLATTTHVEQTLTTETIPSSMTTINTTLRDVGTVLHVMPTASSMGPVRPLPDETPVKSLSRLHDIGNFVWATTTPVNTPTSGAPFQGFYPFNTLMNESYVMSVLQFFRYFRADIEVHFRMQSNQFYSGKLMYTAVPASSAAQVPTFSNGGYIARSWVKPKIVSAQTADTLILTLPWLMPTRFESVATLTNSTVFPWYVACDVVHPLRITSSSATDNVTITMQARFVNAVATFPVPLGYNIPTISSTGKKSVFKVERQASSPVIDDNPFSDAGHSWHRPSPVARTAMPTRRSRDPVSDNSASMALATAGSVIHAIANVAVPLAAAVSAAAPLAGMIGCFFDKPNQMSPITRTLEQPEISFTSADIPDSAVALSLYKNSYMGVGSQVPDSQGWTWLKLAMTPAIVQNFMLTNTTRLDPMGVLNGSSPLGFCLACHKFWRSSIRVRIEFSCSTFTTASVVFCLLPWDVTIQSGTGPFVPTIDNTLCQTVVVKGDTVVEFTIPYVAPTDMLPYGVYQDPNTSDAPPFFGTSALCIASYGPILTNDPSADAVIDVLIWSAAGPDAQFSLACSPNSNMSSISKGVKPQSDIQDAFSKTFPPFVANCTYLTDNHTVTSEISDTIMDNLKRYQEYTYNSTTLFTASYSPAANSLGAWIKSLFLFHRGGISYRVFDDSDNCSGVYLNVGDTHSAYGQPGFWKGTNGSELHFSIPWYGTQPYYNQFTLPGYLSPASPLVPSTAPRACFTAVRDDYQMGFLIPPSLLFSNLPTLTFGDPRPTISAPKALSLLSSFEFA
jgi:hypothetical protein